MTISELCKQAHKTACDKGFWDTERNYGELLALIHSELSEALEALRDGNHHIKIRTETPKEEIWKDVKNYPVQYMVSNLGRVRSLDMLVCYSDKEYAKEGRILRPGISGEGYNTVSLKGQTVKVAVLVGRAFLSNLSDKPCINHINGNKLDDNVNNLEWVTHKENNAHALQTGLRVMDKKLSIEQCLEILSNFKYSNSSLKNLAKEYKVHISSIKKAKQRAEKELKSFEMEIADTFIRLGDLCEALDIDIEWQIKQKMSFNKTRPNKHGKEF